MGVSPLQLVNLHRNRRYFVIKLHTWFCPSYFLKTNIKFYCIYQYFMSINSFFNTVSVSRYSRPISNETSHVTTHATHSDPWPTLARSTSLFLICCYDKCKLYYMFAFKSGLSIYSVYWSHIFSAIPMQQWIGWNALIGQSKYPKINLESLVIFI